jgi:hypothetical protein
MDHAPVALFVYNRPAHTRRTAEALAANEGARETDLFVFSDGPRGPREEAQVREVRVYLKALAGFRTLTVIERPSNLGLRASIVEGVTRLCSERGRVIVLEDDLVTSPHFLSFMNGGLRRFADDAPVMQVAGFMFPSAVRFGEDAALLPLVTSWGWATWQRAWRHFDPAGEGYARLAADRALRRRFDLNGHYPYFRLLKAQRRGRADSWAILWYLSVFLKQGLGLFPRKTLVYNIGFDGSGANRFARGFEQDALDPDFKVATWPRSAEPSPLADEVVNGLPAPRFTLSALLKRMLSLLPE